MEYVVAVYAFSFLCIVSVGIKIDILAYAWASGWMTGGAKFDKCHLVTYSSSSELQ